MMHQLCIQDGEIVEVQNVSLSLASYSKFQPQTVDFLDIHNPKAVYPKSYYAMNNLDYGVIFSGWRVNFDPLLV